ncbi:2-dehydro-3-deoxygalactonokinase [Devosia sp. DBB001]|nr:2-dehydro-3-deoxygalactonokinase [Devosia sp. DBB001]
MYIAIEWTSSAFHAWLMQADGTVAAEHQSLAGVNSVRDGSFEACLRSEIGAWLPQSKAILLSGMVTSRTGWVETPFAMAPAGIADMLAQAIRSDLPNLPPLYFLPGIARLDPLPDVMRGEEMSIFGMESPLPDLLVLPGAHSKWVRTDGQRIVDLTTYMSGEILNLLRRDSLVSRLIPAEYVPNAAAFDRGVEIARDKSLLRGGVLQRVFSARSLVLFDQLPPADIADYLAGVVFGSEIVEALAGDDRPDTVIVLGETPLAASYRRALAQFGLASPLSSGRPYDGFAKLIAALESR